MWILDGSNGHVLGTSEEIGELNLGISSHQGLQQNVRLSSDGIHARKATADTHGHLSLRGQSHGQARTVDASDVLEIVKVVVLLGSLHFVDGVTREALRREIVAVRAVVHRIDWRASHRDLASHDGVIDREIDRYSTVLDRKGNAIDKEVCLFVSLYGGLGLELRKGSTSFYFLLLLLRVVPNFGTHFSAQIRNQSKTSRPSRIKERTNPVN
jgi:hypothetical protein